MLRVCVGYFSSLIRGQKSAEKRLKRQKTNVKGGEILICRSQKLKINQPEPASSFVRGVFQQPVKSHTVFDAHLLVNQLDLQDGF
mgnify:FL=1